jgi:hypothetical protein
MSQCKVVSEDEAFELLVFLITSARGCVDEPKLYGTFRLVDAASKLVGFVLEDHPEQSEGFLRDLKQEIDEKKLSLMADQEGYIEFLGDITREVAQELKRRG